MQIMFLSDLDIQAALNTGSIEINPFSAERLDGASYTFSLGPRLSVPLKSEAPIDPEFPVISYDEVIMGEDGFAMPPGLFVLGSLAETIALDRTIAGMFDGRSTLARIGLNALVGDSTHIAPGQKPCNLTLEMKVEGPSTVVIKPGMPIVKVVFSMLKTPTNRFYDGRYAGQRQPAALPSR